MTMVPFLIWAERRVVARIQVRLGPNRVGPEGLFQPLADAVKLIFKEDITPSGVDRWLYFAAPMLSMIPALLAYAVIPMDPNLQITDINVGLLFLLGLSSLAVYGIVVAGWSSNSKYPLLGALRSSAQMLSYELPMGMAVLNVVVAAGTLSLREIVGQQEGMWFGNALHHLYLLPAFVVYLISGLAETNRAPFDLPEAESELVAGFHTEYSSFKFAMFFMAEYVNMVTISSIAVTLFWGGYHSPIPFAPFTWVPGFGWYMLKILSFLFLFIWLRATLPRLRYDQLMRLGWKVLWPLALVNLMVTALFVAR
ncbi:MAG: NADH-quinone oxidoreductase subunit NuoH [Armatimonadetes bacterium]|nr:NADH-quinone oxidoreductase subunit NuoH [Armatimonadota bacterium]